MLKSSGRRSDVGYITIWLLIQTSDCRHDCECLTSRTTRHPIDSRIRSAHRQCCKRCLPGPLTPGRSFSVQVAVGRASRCSRSYDVLTLVVSFVQSLQLLISLRATMIAMITMSTTRMMSRISVRPIPSSPPVVVPVAGDAPVA